MTNDSHIQIYRTKDGETRVDVRFEKETVWLTQRQMGEVFDTTPENVLMHLKNIYKTRELEQTLALIQNAAKSPVLTGTNAAVHFCLWIFFTAIAA